MSVINKNILDLQGLQTYDPQLKAWALNKLAPAFSASVAYVKDDAVTYDNKIYKFTANHAAGAWTGLDVVETRIIDLIEEDSDIKDTMTRAQFENAQNLPTGIYPIEGDNNDLTVISADMVSYGNGTVKDALDEGTSGGGHVIEDADGTEMSQEPTMQFADAKVTDDSTNDKTVIEILNTPMTRQAFEDAVNLDDGLYPIEGDNDNAVLSSDMISHGNGTVEQAIDGKVSKSGDTMSGKLVINANTQVPISVSNANANGPCYMGFRNQNGILGYYLVGTDYKPHFENRNGVDTPIALTSDIEYHIFRNGNPLSSYSCSISLDSGNRAFIILTRYGIWWGSVIDGGNNVLTQPLYTTTDAVRTITSASYSSGTLTIGFNGGMYGGITIIR